MLLRVLALALFAGLGTFVGCVGAGIRGLQTTKADAAHFSEAGPAPHHVPPQAGGIAFRFAMIHDVLHERYPKHGIAYYREMEHLTRIRLAELPPDVPLAYLATDDLAIALAYQSRHEEAIGVLRAKLARQVAAKLPEHERYTTYANLGFVLMDDSEPRSPARFSEGVAFAKKAVAANPNPHFGRETWQVLLAEHIELGLRSPAVLSTRDFLGSPFDASGVLRPDSWTHRSEGIGRSASYDYVHGRTERTLSFDDPVDDPTQWERFKPIREHITKLKRDDNDTSGPPFDEPMLAVVGMWRQSRTPSPHLAIAIGETMLRVGQRSLAWCAFARAVKLSATGTRLHEHAAGRLGRLPTPELREPFEAELAFGESYQKEYQAFEAKRIADGVPLGDANFYTPFRTGREPIASPSGDEEIVSRRDPARERSYHFTRTVAWSLIGAAIGVLPVTLVIHLRSYLARRMPPPPPPNAV